MFGAGERARRALVRGVRVTGSIRAALLSWSTGLTNLTITVDEEVLKRARIRAIHEGTSVSSVMQSFLESWSGSATGETSAADLVALARRSTSGSGPGGRRWTRDELHERKGVLRHEHRRLRVR